MLLLFLVFVNPFSLYPQSECWLSAMDLYNSPQAGIYATPTWLLTYGHCRTGEIILLLLPTCRLIFPLHLQTPISLFCASTLHSCTVSLLFFIFQF